jgi:hypothetical protein
MNVPPSSSSGWQSTPPDRPHPNECTKGERSAAGCTRGESRPPAGTGEAARANELRSRLPAQGAQLRDVCVTLLEAMQTALDSGMLDPARSYALRRLIKQLDLIDTLINSPPGIGRSRMRDSPRHTEKALSLLREVVAEELIRMTLRADVTGIGKGSEEFASEKSGLSNRERELRRQWNELPRGSPKVAPKPEEAIGPLVDQLSALTSFWKKWLAPLHND